MSGLPFTQMWDKVTTGAYDVIAENPHQVLFGREVKKAMQAAPAASVADIRRIVNAADPSVPHALRPLVVRHIVSAARELNFNLAD